MAREIIYNGAVIATLEDGQRATLACAGKKMLSDVVIVVSADSGGATLPETGVDAATGEITDTWEQIQTAISSGVYSTRYAVGNYKTMTLTDGTAVEMQIVAFNADTLASDSTKTVAISWVSKGIVTTHAMNPTNTNTGGWEASEMRRWLRGDFYATLPTEVTDHIVEVNKTYYEKPSGTTKSCADNVWIPSYREVFGNSSNDTRYETSGADYTDYFNSASARIKVTSSGSAAAWWLRSAYSSYYFRNVDSGGLANYTAAYGSSGVVLGFCM